MDYVEHIAGIEVSYRKQLYIRTTTQPMESDKRVVIIDDDDDDCSFIQLGLDRWVSGITIHRFISGEAFIESKVWQETEHNFKVILLELILPGEDGLNWLRTFLQHECCLGTPVVMYSCLAISPDTCKQAGAADYIEKPCNDRELNEVASKICNSWLLN